MLKAVEQYFIEQEVLDLPSLGSLRKSKIEASVNDAQWSMPTESIVFETYQNKPTPKFYTYLAQQLDTSESSVITQYNQLIADFVTHPDTELNLGSLGTFKHINGTIQWNSLYQSEAYFSPISLPIKESSFLDETLLMEDNNNWLKWSLLLISIAFALIIYKNF